MFPYPYIIYDGKQRTVSVVGLNPAWQGMEVFKRRTVVVILIESFIIIITGDGDSHMAVDACCTNK